MAASTRGCLRTSLLGPLFRLFPVGDAKWSNPPLQGSTAGGLLLRPPLGYSSGLSRLWSSALACFLNPSLSPFIRVAAPFLSHLRSTILLLVSAARSQGG